MKKFARNLGLAIWYITAWTIIAAIIIVAMPVFIAIGLIQAATKA